MGICTQCIYFRRVKPASQFLAQAVGTTDAAVSNALVKIQEDENQQKGYEAQLKSKKEIANDEEWGFRPMMFEFCGIRETEEIYLITGVKNLGGRCTDFASGRPPKRSCNGCAYRVKAQGDATDAAVEKGYGSMAVSSIAVGLSSQRSDNLLNKYEEGIGPRRAIEINGAYTAKGVLINRPQYLDYCAKFSVEDEYVVCVMQNPHSTCQAWELKSAESGKNDELPMIQQTETGTLDQYNNSVNIGNYGFLLSDNQLLVSQLGTAGKVGGSYEVESLSLRKWITLQDRMGANLPVSVYNDRGTIKVQVGLPPQENLSVAVPFDAKPWKFEAQDWDKNLWSFTEHPTLNYRLELDTDEDRLSIIKPTKVRAEFRVSVLPNGNWVQLMDDKNQELPIKVCREGVHLQVEWLP